mgnify:CR=1 FL=1
MRQQPEITLKKSVMEQEVLDKLYELQQRGLMFFEPIEAHVIVSNYKYNVGNNEITIILDTEDATSDYKLKKRELDDFIKKIQRRPKGR